MNTSVRFILILISFSMLACGGVDITFVNKVKIFEPKWIDLSEKFSFIQRNLDLTDRRYDQDLSQVESLFSSVGSDARVELSNLRSKYREMIKERDEIRKDSENKNDSFSELVHSFNDWENKLMKGKLDEEKARADFIIYQKEYEKLDREVRELQTRLLKNIETHNSLLQSMTRKLEIFTNYDMQAK